MSLKLFECRISKTIIKEAPLGDLIRGIGSGFTKVFKDKLGLKSDEDLQREAEEAYNAWFNKMKFKEIDEPGEDIIKAYMLPLGKSEKGVKILVLKDTEWEKDLVKRIEEEDEEAIQLLQSIEEGDSSYKTFLQATLFDKGISRENLKNLINIDLSQLENLAIKNNGTFKDENEISDSIIKKLVEYNKKFRKLNLSIFDADWTISDFNTFTKHISNNQFNDIDKDLIIKSVSRFLSKQNLNMQQLVGLNKGNKISELFEDDPVYRDILQGLEEGTIEDDKELKMALRDGGKDPKKYWFEILYRIIANVIND